MSERSFVQKKCQKSVFYRLFYKKSWLCDAKSDTGRLAGPGRRGKKKRKEFGDIISFSFYNKVVLVLVLIVALHFYIFVLVFVLVSVLFYNKVLVLV